MFTVLGCYTVFESTTLYSVLRPKGLNCFIKTVGKCWLYELL